MILTEIITYQIALQILTVSPTKLKWVRAHRLIMLMVIVTMIVWIQVEIVTIHVSVRHRDGKLHVHTPHVPVAVKIHQIIVTIQHSVKGLEVDQISYLSASLSATKVTVILTIIHIVTVHASVEW